MFYKAINVSKQSLHQTIERRMKSDEQSAYLITIIQQIRSDHPTLNCRAMYHKIQPQHIGRDKFESLCFQWGFSIERPINYIRTTNSNGVIRFDNLTEGLVVIKVNQVWSSDITYFELNGRFYYLTFILDNYSRYIVGHNVSSRLTTEKTTLPSLKMALKTRNFQIPTGVIFHSDGGGQYYDKEFLALTKHYHFKNSMCELAYQNGKAERINGIIKNNYLIHRNIKTYEDLVKEVDRSVSLYNNDKPHKALKYKTPLQIEKESYICSSKLS
jgi:transposase InsO family protein